jgi:hypothetical protein
MAPVGFEPVADLVEFPEVFTVQLLAEGGNTGDTGPAPTTPTTDGGNPQTPTFAG